jgi:gliding motility-associated-like protein
MVLCWCNILAQVFFTPNKGQWHSSIQAKVDLANGAMFLEEKALTFNFIDATYYSHSHDYNSMVDSIQAHAFKWHFVRANTPEISFEEERKGLVNFFNVKPTVSDVKTYNKVNYKNIYDGIDYTIYEYANALKYDWIVQPNADPTDIKLRLEGVKDIRIEEDRLYLRTSLNEIREERPYAYQWDADKKVEVECHFVLKKQRLSFEFPNGYDESKILVIDPEMIFSSYSGSVASNFGYTATYDDYGYLYAGGTAYNIGYPITVGAYQTAYNGGVVGNDLVLSKYDTTGTFMVYSTYLGGSGDEVPHSLIVYDEELFVMGTTGSADFPISEGAFDDTFNGGQALAVNGVGINYTNGCDIFISRLNAEGTDLLSSTFLGGTDNDGFNSSTALRYNYADQMRGEIDIDEDGNCYIASSTFSDDFPIVNSLIQPAINGGQDGIIVKMDLDLSQIQWSSYWGGSSDDALYSLAFDSNNDLYACGGTESNNLTTTIGAYAPNYLGGAVDAFVSHFSKDGQSVLHSTYYGSDQYDQSYFIELDKFDQVYLFGQSLAPDNTLIFNAVFSQPNSGQFVSKLNSELNTLDFSTVFGSGSGGIDISPTAFLVDACNRIYCSGWGGATNDSTHLGPGGTTTDLVTTFDAFQSETDGSDFYLIIFEDDANTLSFASFFGGDQAAEHVDGGTSRFDKKGIVYQSVCAGCGGFSDFPTTDNAVSNTNGASCNNAVFKFDPDFPLTVANFNAPSLTCEWTVTFENLSLGDNNTYYWDFGDGSTSTDTTPTHSFTSIGTYEVLLISSDPTSCNLADSIIKTITIDENTYQELDSLFICLGDSVLLEAPTVDGYSYQWYPNEGIANSLESTTYASPTDSIMYYFIGQSDNCYDTVSQYVSVKDVLLDYEPSAEICGLPILLSVQATNTTLIEWSVNADFTNSLQQDSLPVSSVGTYYLRGTEYGCSKSASIDVKLGEECCSEDNILIPNAFTPNGDLLNEKFRIKDELNIVQDMELYIFNRWGQKVFFSDNKSQSWDGYFKGELQPSSVFDYHVNIECVGGEKSFFKKGNITLIR